MNEKKKRTNIHKRQTTAHIAQNTQYYTYQTTIKHAQCNGQKHNHLSIVIMVRSCFDLIILTI